MVWRRDFLPVRDAKGDGVCTLLTSKSSGLGRESKTPIDCVGKPDACCRCDIWVVPTGERRRWVGTAPPRPGDTTADITAIKTATGGFQMNVNKRQQGHSPTSYGQRAVRRRKPGLAYEHCMPTEAHTRGWYMCRQLSSQSPNFVPNHTGEVLSEKLSTSTMSCYRQRLALVAKASTARRAHG
jgi:hypothetical protein